MTAFLINLLQIVFLIALAPLVTGLIKKVKALLQTRRGPRIYQPYLDLYKYMQKESVVSEHTSRIFRVTPFIYLSALIVAAGLMPVISTQGLFNFSGDLILIVYLFALARFFLALAGLDAGSAFGGMASSREMAVSSVAEPVVMLPMFIMAVVVGTTNLTGIVSTVEQTGALLLTPTHWLAFIAFFVVAIAETGRIPVDNPDTHLELTMIHEGMLLEYSGKPLALLSLGASLKQLLIFTLMANVFFPWGIAGGLGLGQIALAIVTYLAKISIFSLAMAVIETSMAKMRLFKVPGLLLGSFLLAFLGLVSKFVL